MDRGPRVQAFPPRHKGDRATPSIVFAPDGLAPSLGSPAACVDLSLDSNVKDCLNDLRRRFMQPLSRRNVLTAAAAGTVVTASIAANAQTFGNPDLLPQGAINTRDNPASVTDPGPQNPALASQFPDASLRRRPTSATCRCSGHPSTMLRAAFRTAVGRDRSPRPISRSRRKSPASTC